MNVHQHRSGSAHLHGGYRGHSRVGHGDHFIAGADAEGKASEVEGFGGVGDGEAVGRRGELGEGLFEVVRHVSHC